MPAAPNLAALLAAWDNFYVLVAAAVVFILFVGIHNAWDAAIYVSVRRGEDLLKP